VKVESNAQLVLMFRDQPVACASVLCGHANDVDKFVSAEVLSTHIDALTSQTGE
jgi:hypothetical protein